MEDLKKYLNKIRRDFVYKPLSKDDVSSNPFTQFDKWFKESIDAQVLDPYAMTIATFDNHQPDLRVVYLRDISEAGLVFFSNYMSKKGQDLSLVNQAGANFFWPELDRQIRIKGTVEKVNSEISDNYFASRPRESQIGAWASNQSHEISNREELENLVREYTNKFEGKEIPRPDHWGGYIIKPNSFEFWQGRPSRLHDRIIYKLEKDDWSLIRVAP